MRTLLCYLIMCPTTGCCMYHQCLEKLSERVDSEYSYLPPPVNNGRQNRDIKGGQMTSHRIYHLVFHILNSTLIQVCGLMLQTPLAVSISFNLTVSYITSRYNMSTILLSFNNTSKYFIFNLHFLYLKLALQ